MRISAISSILASMRRDLCVCEGACGTCESSSRPVLLFAHWRDLGAINAFESISVTICHQTMFTWSCPRGSEHRGPTCREGRVTSRFAMRLTARERTSCNVDASTTPYNTCKDGPQMSVCRAGHRSHGPWERVRGAGLKLGMPAVARLLCLFFAWTLNRRAFSVDRIDACKAASH